MVAVILLKAVVAVIILEAVVALILFNGYSHSIPCLIVIMTLSLLNSRGGSFHVKWL